MKKIPRLLPHSIFHATKPLNLRIGQRVLYPYHIAYETWGTLSDAKDNGVLIHTGLSASSHAKSHSGAPERGWWEDFIGPGRAIDTNKFFVICSNLLGSCHGSSGPSTPDAATGKPLALEFPILSVHDMVDAQCELLDHLGIAQLHASVGASLGGMQALCLATEHAERSRRFVFISTGLHATAASIAIRYVQRQVIMMDPNWNEGNYYDGLLPVNGLRLSRKIATMTYRSGPEWEARFGARRKANFTSSPFREEYEIEEYIHHQGDKFIGKYDPNSLLYLSRAMDMFTIDDVSAVTHPSLVIGVTSDLLFPVFQQKDLVSRLREAGNSNVDFVELDAKYGHDTFLLDVDGVGSSIRTHLEAGI